jgi:hypothetical protein
LTLTANVFSVSTSPHFTTPNIDVATATSVNGLTINLTTGTLAIANGKTATFNNTTTFTGTDNTVQIFPGSSGNVVTSVPAAGGGLAGTYPNPSIASVPASALPNRSVSTLGGVQSAAAVAHNWIASISTSGVPALSQPAFTDISGSVVATQMPALTGDVTTTAGAVATTIAASAVTNAKMANMNAYTLKGNATGSAAAPGDIDVTALTLKSSPVSGDIVLIQDSAASNAFKRTTVGALSSAVSVASIAGNTGAFTLNNGITNTTNAIGLTVGQLPGSTGNTVASAGNIGELISSNVLVGSMVSLTSGSPANITSIPLTAGHWELSGSVGIEGGASTSVGNIFGGISPTSATVPTTANGGAYFGSRQSGFTISTGQSPICYPVGAADVYVSAPTTYFLVAQAAFTVSTLGGYGFLRARRVQ